MTAKSSPARQAEQPGPAAQRPGETREEFLKRVLDEADVEHRETLDRLAQ